MFDVVVSTVSYVMNIDFSALLRLHSIVVLEYLNQQVKLRDGKSLLQVSKNAFEGDTN